MKVPSKKELKDALYEIHCLAREYAGEFPAAAAEFAQITDMAGDLLRDDQWYKDLGLFAPLVGVPAGEPKAAELEPDNPSLFGHRKEEPLRPEDSQPEEAEENAPEEPEESGGSGNPPSFFGVRKNLSEWREQ